MFSSFTSTNKTIHCDRDIAFPWLKQKFFTYLLPRYESNNSYNRPKIIIGIIDRENHTNVDLISAMYSVRSVINLLSIKRCRHSRLNFRNKMQYRAFSACFNETKRKEKKIDACWRILLLFLILHKLSYWSSFIRMHFFGYSVLHVKYVGQW